MIAFANVIHKSKKEYKMSDQDDVFNNFYSNIQTISK